MLGSVAGILLALGVRQVARWVSFTASRRWLKAITNREPQLRELSDEQLRRESLSLKHRAICGEPLDRLVPESFALVREASRRTLGLRHYDVQILGGLAMHQGAIAEMQTGEGKTLTAMLPLYVAALRGRGAHLATANDYLAQRDAEYVRPAFELLGMSVGAIDTATPRLQRRQAYACDVTYAPARELGFDFLRDRLLGGGVNEARAEWLGRLLGHTAAASPLAPVQRELHFCLVDEADSILIDEARTPLIVSTGPGAAAETSRMLYEWAASVTDRFHEPDDIELDLHQRTATLTAPGRRKVRDLPKPDAAAQVSMPELYQYIERALLVRHLYVRDRHYVIRQGEVVIVDEFTGRLAEGRKWRDGIHQAIEAQEGLSIGVATGDAARVTVQDFFLLYRRLAGMTGTIASSAREMRRIYRLRVRVIPTHRPSRRQALPDLVLGTSAARWQAVLQEVQELQSEGRPVLIGTRSIDKSEQLSQLLTAAGIPHEVLNAHRHATEAAIVAQAGQRGKVTVATNMAGRGTDIQLGPGVAELGGLHVICTELHESARIDRQLVGRCARQGDPGTYRQFMSIEDEILVAAYGRETARRLLRKWSTQRPGPLPAAALRLLRRAQRRVEREHFRQRRLLLYYAEQRRKAQLQMGQDLYLDTEG